MHDPNAIHLDIATALDLQHNTQPALVLLQISSQEIHTANIAPALERLHALADTAESARLYRNSLFFVVQGYDDDPRELCEVPQVRAFFARLAQEWPHWLWFLARDTGTVALLFSLLCSVRVHRSGKQTAIEFPSREELAACIEDLAGRSEAFYAGFGISNDEYASSLQSALRELGGHGSTDQDSRGGSLDGDLRAT